MESSPVVSRRSPAKGKSSATQVPRLQTEVVLSTLTPSTSGSKRKPSVFGRQDEEGIGGREPVVVPIREAEQLWRVLVTRQLKLVGGPLQSRKTVTRVAPHTQRVLVETFQTEADLFCRFS